MFAPPLSNELQEKAQRELNEDPQTRGEHIDHIRMWISEQQNLCVRNDDHFILRILRGCKFSREKTKETIANHVAFKKALPEWFKNRDPQETKIRELFQKGLILPLKSNDDSTSRAFIFRQGIYDTKNYTIDDVMRTLLLTYDTFFEMDQVYQVNGIIIIVDQRNFSLSHVFQYTPTKVKNMLQMWQDGYALQNKRLYFIYNGKFFNILFKIAKLFMKEELIQILELCNSDLERMYKDVPKSSLPKEYGGDGETVQQIIDYWLGIMDSKRDWILENQEKYS